MAFTIPVTPGVPHLAVTTVLEGVAYGFEFRWSTREACFYANLLTAEGDLIYAGMKVVTGAPLFERCADERRFPGRIFAMDTEGKGRSPGLEDLGDRVLLVYLTAAEVAAGSGE